MVLIFIGYDIYFLIPLFYPKIFLKTVCNLQLTIIFYCYGASESLYSSNIVNNSIQIQIVITFEDRNTEP